MKNGEIIYFFVRILRGFIRRCGVIAQDAENISMPHAIL
jgi:hypothetical protein